MIDVLDVIDALSRVLDKMTRIFMRQRNDERRTARAVRVAQRLDRSSRRLSH